MPRFFIKKENIQENKINITNISDINHITNVLRHKKNDRLILSCNDSFVYEAEITSVKPEVIEATITDKYFSDKILKTNITLAQSIIKSQKQDFLIQKATELGVKTIIPFTSKNTIVKFDSEKDKLSKVQRWQKIVYESTKQCQRGDLAEVKKIATLDEVVNFDMNEFIEKKQSSFSNTPASHLKIFCSEKESSFSIKKFLSNATTPVPDNSLNVLLVIGPEGGWTDEETVKFTKKGFASVTLGKLIYRAETAATVALSHIIYALEL